MSHPHAASMVSFPAPLTAPPPPPLGPGPQPRGNSPLSTPAGPPLTSHGISAAHNPFLLSLAPKGPQHLISCSLPGSVFLGLGLPLPTLSAATATHSRQPETGNRLGAADRAPASSLTSAHSASPLGSVGVL